MSETSVMTPLSAEATQRARWSEVKSERRTYTLRSEEHLLGGLRFERASGSLATADSAGGRWTFKRVGFFSTRVTVRRPNAEANEAVFTPSLSGGTLRTAGSTFEWRSLGLWSFEHGWFRDGVELLRVKPSSQSKVEAEVIVAAGSSRAPELELLALLGFYLLLLAAEDAAAVAAATTVATT